MKEQRGGGRSNNRKEQQGERTEVEEGATRRKGQQSGKSHKESEKLMNKQKEVSTLFPSQQFLLPH